MKLVLLLLFLGIVLWAIGCGSEGHTLINAAGIIIKVIAVCIGLGLIYAAIVASKK